MCKDNAINEVYEPIGEVNEYGTVDTIVLKEGRLEVGLPHQTALIRALKKQHLPDTDIAIFDAPPGTSCPVVNTLEGSDYTIIVAEPSPFGLNDLKLMVEVIRDIGIPFDVVINKSGDNDAAMEKYLHQEKIDIIARIPLNREIATAYANASIEQIASHKSMQKHLKHIWKTIKQKTLV